MVLWPLRGTPQDTPRFQALLGDGSRLVISSGFRREAMSRNTPPAGDPRPALTLKGQSTIAAKRNVLKRFERVEILKARGQFKLGDKVIGLRKTKPNE